MRSRAIDRAKGLAALAAVVAALAAPPVALKRFVGNPLPSSVPSLRGMVDGLTRGGISDRAVIDVLAVLAWIIWAQIAVALIAETAAVARGRQASRLPLLPGVQPLAARWLAAVALLLVSLAPSPSATAAKRAPLTVPLPDPVPAVRFVDDRPPVEEAPTAPAPAIAGERPLLEYVVQRHDSFWDIAERFLGDSFRWREIRDLNVGRPQPGGETVDAGSDLIRPGWRLLVPADRLPAPSGTTPAATAERTVSSGDHLWGVADDALSAHLGRPASDEEVRTYWQALVDLNPDVLADPANPSLVFAGQVVRLPPLPQTMLPTTAADVSADRSPPAPVSTEPDILDAPPGPTAAEPVPATPPATAPTSAPRADPNTRAADAADEGETGATAPLAGLLGVAGAGLAVGLTAAVRARRRQRITRAPAGFAPPPTPHELDPLRTEMALAADVDASDDLHRAVAAIAEHVATTRGMGQRRPRLAQRSPDRVEVLLDEPALPAPSGWEPEASGAVWFRERPVPWIGAHSASPTLVTIGSDGGTSVHLDLESAGLVTIASDDGERAFALARSIILELDHSPHAPVISLLIVGGIAHAESDRIRHADRWEDVSEDVLSWACQSRHVLDANRLRTAFEARGTGRPLDGIAPLVIVCSELPAGDTFDEFCALARQGAAACTVVIGAETAGSTHVQIDGDTITLPAFDLTCRAQGISTEVVEQAGELLTAAAQPAEPMTLWHGDETIDVDASPHTYGDPPWDVLVQVLGEIRVVGGHKLLTPKQTGMLAFVALHDVCSADRIEEAIWPGPMGTRRQQVHNTASRIRAALGADHLPASSDSEYRVGPKVRTDLDLFRRRAAYAKTQQPAQAIETLRGALALVEGPAFTYRSADRAAFTWVDTEHWTSETEARIVEVAWRMWHLCTEHGDTQGAIWAARQGLLASPGNTELTDALMRAYLSAGDRAAAKDVFMSHAKALDELEQDDPAPSTLQLWEDMQEGREPSRS